MSILDKTICSFLQGTTTEYLEAKYDLREVQSYIDYLWMAIKPKGEILNMGIMKKTPSNLQWPVMSEYVTSITHIELDDQREVIVNSKERVIWNTDFYQFLKQRHKNKSFVNGISVWHGPEHMTKKIGVKTIKYALKVATDWIVVACPWDRLRGWKNQPKDKEHLGHKSVWTQDDFLDLDMRVISSGKRGVHPGHLIAWKKLCE